jgi:nucleotide-binding universal stress UspA family protein
MATPLDSGFELGGGVIVSDWLRNRAEQAERDLHGFLKDEFQGLEVSRVFLEGDPAARIVEYSHEQNAGLILMPTHGYGPFRRFILGSNTAKVLHDADCPVWTGVHMPDQPARASGDSWRRVLCAVDLGPQSARTLEWATWMARACGAQLTLLHAMACTSETDPNWRTQIRDGVEAELSKLRNDAGVKADLLIEAGEPARVICDTASRVRADIVVIGRGSAAGVFGRLRTNAYAIIRQSPCPVVSV